MKVFAPLAAALIATTLSPAAASADTNMLEGSFLKTFIDAETDGLKIQRRYDSRSNFGGLFGFGWCSTFDIKLIFGKALQLNECGTLTSPETVRYLGGMYVQTLPNGLVRTFSSETGDLTKLQAPGGREIAIERSRLPRDAALGEGLKMRTEETSNQRNTNGATIILLFDSLGENIVALALPDDQRTDTTKQTIATARTHASAQTTITPTTTTPTTITPTSITPTSNASTINTPANSLQKSPASTTTTTKLLRFTYSADRNLLEATNAWANTYSFEYDLLHNLTRIEYPDHTQEQIEYDTDKDQITKYQGRDRCIEIYDHVISRTAQDIHQISQAQLTCPGNKPARGLRFDFYFTRKNAKWSLKTMKRSAQ